ncbi:pseudaminic acid cytidylyltransferase [Phaeodactylibacter xiamenensis]|uniref:pseudaminic acid cytidylyltransferase n=1 Tax=Phaeodactylibacter xiamenensis TaxID=1524460 RepID=UPI003CCC38C4
MKRLAIIPARGGSKRIPRKNIKLFRGVPIISYSIRLAQESGLFDEVMVSTDDLEIAEIARQFEASVPFLRSKQNASDFATTFDVISEVINEYKNLEDNFYQAACIYPAAPFITVELLKKACKRLEKENLDCVFPAVQFNYPIQRSFRLKKHGRMEMFQPEHLLTRSQDLEKAYHDSGQFYFFNVKRLMKAGKLWTHNTGVIVISNMLAQDIDEENDWEMAEFKYDYLEKLGKL